LLDPQAISKLVSLCVEGDDGARARFWTEYHGLVRRAVARKVAVVGGWQAVSSDIDDLCNEIFARLFANECKLLERLRNPKSINAWLITLAQNYVLDLARKSSSRKRVEMSAREGQAPQTDGRGP